MNVDDRNGGYWRRVGKGFSLLIIIKMIFVLCGYRQGMPRARRNPIPLERVQDSRFQNLKAVDGLEECLSQPPMQN